MQINAISLPIYLLLKDSGEIIAYDSPEKMQGDLEAIDVENNEYEAWDADGRLLQLQVGPEKSEWLQIMKSDKVLSNVDLTEIKEKAVPYRDSGPLLRNIGRRLGLLRADD